MIADFTEFYSCARLCGGNYMKVMVSSVFILVFQSTLMSNYLEAKVFYAFSILKTNFGLVLTKARIR